MKFLCILFFAPMVLCFSLKGEKLHSNEAMSLAELIDIALKNNPETAKVWSNVKRAQAVLGVTENGLYPHLNAQGSVTHAREVKFPNGPDTTFTSYGGEMNLNYLLCDFGETRAAVRAAKEGLIASKWWADFAMQKIIADVAMNYYELLNARELLETRESSLEDAKTILEAAKELRQAGLRSDSDLIVVKAAVSEILMHVTQQKAVSAIAYGKLMTVLGVPIEKKLEVQTKPEGIHHPHFSQGIGTLLTVAQEQRADLLAKRAALEEANARVTRANRAPLPKVRALGQAGWLKYGKGNENGYNYSVGLAIDIPLFKGFEYMYQKRQAMAEAEISAAELKELQNAVALEVLTYSEMVKSSCERRRYSEEFFTEAFHSYEHALESYKAGLINIFDLLQAQRYLADARNRRAQTHTEWLVALSQLAFAIGSMEK